MNRNSPRRELRVIASLLASLLLVPELSPAGEDGAADLAVFRQSVAPFLRQHCVRCHGSNRQEADFTLHTIDGDLSAGNDVARWKAIAERLALNEMPPQPEPRPDVKARLVVQRWISQGLATRGESLVEVEAKLLLPGQGNRVDHDALFSGAVTGPAASPSRLWRFSPQIYAALAPRITGKRPGPYGNGPQLAQPFSTSSADGFKDFAALFVIDEPTIVQLMRNARLAVDLQSNLGGAIKPLLNPDHRATEAEMRAAISHQFRLVLRREPTEEELARFVELMSRNIEGAGAAIGVKTTLAAVLLLPEALYRFERGYGEPDEFGRRMLAPREAALDERNFSRAVARRLPADVLFDAVQQATAGPAELTRVTSDVAERAIGTRGGAFVGRYGDGNYASQVFGRSTRDANCDCSASNEPNLLQAIYLQNDKEVLGAMERKGGWLHEIGGRLAKAPKSPESVVGRDALIREAFLRTVSRAPTAAEMERSARHLDNTGNPGEGMYELLWALLNTREFVTNH